MDHSPTKRSVSRSDRATYIPYLGSGSVPAVVATGVRETRPRDGEARNLSAQGQAVELQVTNLDQTIEQREMKRMLMALFR